MQGITRTLGNASLVLALAAPALAQNTWYVDITATPPGVGTQAQPYTSIQYAIDRPTTLTDDTIIVAPGIYAERAGSPSKFLILRSSQGPFKTMIRPGIPGPIVVFPNTYANSTFPTVEGFRLQGEPGIFMEGISSADIIVRNCIIDAGYDATLTNAVGVRAEVSVRMDRCTIINFGRAVTLNDFFGSPSETRLSNSILHHGAGGTNLSLEYCQYEGQLSGAVLVVGNISGPPGVWSAPNGDVHLKPLSPCIDKGNPSMFDPDGTRLDIGVIPYDPNYAGIPVTYCVGKQHSAGCTPQIRFTGTPSYSGSDDFHVHADSALNKKPGLILWGYKASSSPFNGGTLCLGTPIVRGPVLSSGGNPGGPDCSGHFDWHFDNAYAQSLFILDGRNVYVQAWGRDPGYAPPNNSQLSNAGVFHFSP